MGYGSVILQNGAGGYINTVRFDSLIHKRYLRGDFGGVPQLPFVNLFELMDAERSAQ